MYGPLQGQWHSLPRHTYRIKWTLEQLSKLPNAGSVLDSNFKREGSELYARRGVADVAIEIQPRFQSQ